MGHQNFDIVFRLSTLLSVGRERRIDLGAASTLPYYQAANSELANNGVGRWSKGWKVTKAQIISLNTFVDNIYQ